MVNRNKSMVSPLLGGTAIAVALYTILFGGTRSLDVPSSERMLSELSSHLSEESSHRGKEAKLQYSNLEIRGFGYEKFAHISQLSLDFIYQQWQGGRRFGISTASADLIPDPATHSRMFMRFTDAINIISSSQLLAIVQPAHPIVYAFNTVNKEADAIRHRVVIPGNIGITMLNPKREVTVQVKSPVKTDATFFKTQHRLSAQLTSGALVAQSDTGQWRLDSTDIRYESVQKSADTIESKGTIALENIGFNQPEITPAPYSFTAAWMMKEQRNISGSTDASELIIEHGLLTNGNVKLSLNGTMNFDIDDAPYGELTVEINNPLAFLQSPWIAADKKEAGLALLNEVIGEEFDNTKQVIITIARPKNGQWMVGKLPLHALLDKGFYDLFTFMKEHPSNDQANSQTSPAT